MHRMRYGSRISGTSTGQMVKVLRHRGRGCAGVVTGNAFYKRKSQEKNIPHRRNFSCFPAPSTEQDVFGPATPFARLLGMGPGGWGVLS